MCPTDLVGRLASVVVFERQPSKMNYSKWNFRRIGQIIVEKMIIIPLIYLFQLCGVRPFYGGQFANGFEMSATEFIMCAQNADKRWNKLCGFWHGFGASKIMPFNGCELCNGSANSVDSVVTFNEKLTMFA